MGKVLPFPLAPSIIMLIPLLGHLDSAKWDMQHLWLCGGRKEHMAPYNKHTLIPLSFWTGLS